jgi:hypothetical protein
MNINKANKGCRIVTSGMAYPDSLKLCNFVTRTPNLMCRALGVFREGVGLGQCEAESRGGTDAVTCYATSIIFKCREMRLR